MSYKTANQIINSVAAQVGINPVDDPFSSINGAFRQLRYLLDVAGQELLVLPTTYWPQFIKEFSYTTDGTETDGGVDLPTDFKYMIDQTGWERQSDLPLAGPMNAQDWTYLVGRDLVSSTVYVSFRLKQGKFYLLPAPPAAGLDINFEYVTENWIQEAGTSPAVYRSELTQGTDIVRYDPILITQFLKVKYLEAKGFDSTAARNDFYLLYDSINGKSKGAPVLDITSGPQFPYLDTLRNTPDTGYGG